jgi:hypothetical protein
MRPKLQLQHKLLIPLLHGISFCDPTEVMFSNSIRYAMETTRPLEACEGMLGAHRLGLSKSLTMTSFPFSDDAFS